MSPLSLDKHRLVTCLTEKLCLSFRGKKERNAWFELDGKKILRVTMPKGRGPLREGTAHAIRGQLKLTSEQFRALVRCPLGGTGYEEIIRGKMTRGIL